MLPDAAGEIYGQGNILGTVSQSAGVPTGAIIESGSNANGRFVKYADGTVLCYGDYTGGITVSAVFTGLNAGNVTLTMPTSSVISWNVVSFSGNNQSGPDGWGGKSSTAQSGSACQFRYYTAQSPITITAVQWSVIGRWF